MYPIAKIKMETLAKESGKNISWYIVDMKGLTLIFKKNVTIKICIVNTMPKPDGKFRPHFQLLIEYLFINVFVSISIFRILKC